MEGLKKLDPQKINAAVAAFGWSNDGDAISKAFTFDNFEEAADFVATLGELSDDLEGHAPDLVEIRGPTVLLRLSTHSVGGVSDADLDLASMCDEIVDGILSESVASRWEEEYDYAPDEE